MLPALSTATSARLSTHQSDNFSQPASNANPSFLATISAVDTSSTDLQSSKGSPHEIVLRLAVYPITYKAVFKRFLAIFIDAAGRCAGAIITDQDYVSILNFLALPKVGLASGLRRRCAGDRLAAFPDVEWPRQDDTSVCLVLLPSQFYVS